METAPLTEQAGESDDEDKGNFDKLLEACESSFEREVLHTIRDQGFELPDDAQKVIYDGDEPVAKPDFFYERPGRSIALFVDGPAHEKDYVKEDDEQKRTRLKQLGYRVVPITDIEQVPNVLRTV
ncbi:hypothetical protein ACFQH2_19730 [Natronoarchaeum sp. GCM10025703]